jgi:aspartyl protease family protein
MLKPFLVVISIGAAVGFLWPGGHAAAPTKPVAAASATDEKPRETLLKRHEDGHFYADVEVNGELVHFLIDTGATAVALTEEDARRVGVAVPASQYEYVGMGAGGPIRGANVTIKRISLDGKKADDVHGAVIQGAGISLLGQAYLSRLGSVEMSGDYMRLS